MCIRDRCKNVLVVEHARVLRVRGNGSEEVESLADNRVVLGLLANRGQQVPGARDERLAVLAPVLVILGRKQLEQFANIGLDGVGYARLDIVVCLQDRVRVVEILVQERGDALKILVEDGRDVVARHVVHDLDLEIENLEPALQHILVV